MEFPKKAIVGGGVAGDAAAASVVVDDVLDMVSAPNDREESLAWYGRSPICTTNKDKTTMINVNNPPRKVVEHFMEEEAIMLVDYLCCLWQYREYDGGATK